MARVSPWAAAYGANWAFCRSRGNGRSVVSEPSTGNINPSESPKAHFAVAAFGITWILLAWRTSPSALWASDYTTIKDLSAQAVGYEGIWSQLLVGWFRYLPIGSMIHRVSLVSAFGAAAIAWLTFHLSLAAVKRSDSSTWSGCWLALGSTLLVVHGATVQRTATIPAGTTVAAALGLACIWLTNHYAELDSNQYRSEIVTDSLSRPMYLGALVAFTWLESHAVGLLVTILAIALPMAWGRPWRKANLLGLLGGCLAVMSLLGLPYYLAHRGPAAVSLEQAMVTSLTTRRLFSDFSTRLEPWLRDMGAAWFGIACLGLVQAMLSSDRRRSLWVVLTVLATLVVLPTQSPGCGYHSSLVIVGLAALGAAIAKGLRGATHWAATLRPNAALLATTIAVLAQAVAVLARNEDANYTVNHYRSLGAEAWTDEALVVLPARSVVIVKTPDIYKRLLAAQSTEAVRPDVLVVALEQATDPRIVGSLVAAEPSLAAVLRDLAILGRPSENAMSNLADTRPLFTEFDAHWDPRLRDHLLVQPFLHRVFSQTLGRSDRMAVLSTGQRAVYRLVDLASGGKARGNATHDRDPGDTRTLEVVDGRLREQLTLLLALGDRQSFETLANDYATQFGDSKWLTRLRQRLGSNPRGAVEAFDLLNEDAARDQTVDVPRRRRG